MDKCAMTYAYSCGYRAGRLNKRAGDCPYAGHNDASLSLQVKWMTGYFDGLTRKRERPKATRHRVNVGRRLARKRWPKSDYARRLVIDALNG